MLYLDFFSSRNHFCKYEAVESGLRDRIGKGKYFSRKSIKVHDHKDHETDRLLVCDRPAHDSHSLHVPVTKNNG